MTEPGGESIVSLRAMSTTTQPRRGIVRGVALFAAALTASALAAPRIAPAVESGTIDIRVAAGDDDAEELANRFLDLASSDLELTVEKLPQTVGLRFRGVAVPPGATIASAWIQFTVDETGSAPAELTVRAEDAGDANAFAGNGGITARPLTAASVPWTPPPWTGVGEASAAQRTPDLASVLQAVVARPDWAAGNDVAFIITGSGTRTAESFEGSATQAPLLHIEWVTGPGTTTTTGGETTTTSSIPSTTTTTFATTTTAPPAGVHEAAVASGGDDVEQISSGWLYANSTDLELVNDAGAQTIGLRFTGVPIPQGAAITAAWVQFTVDETTTAPATLRLHLHDTASAPPFSGNSGVSNRPATAAIEWTPDPWLVPGTSGAAQRTPDLSALVQAVVGRGDWAPGGALAVVVTGTGTRTATAFEAGAPPRLHVEWSTGPTPSTTTTTTTPPTTTSTSTTTTVPAGPATRIAVIGDYGSGNARQGQVADMIDAAGVDAVVTTGDNVYATTGYDRLVGRYYHEWIGDYAGIYGIGSFRNRFFPSLGNHDYSDVGLPAYLAFFALPGNGVASLGTSGNERYYDARLGDLHLFILNSQPQEPDGLTPTSPQGVWLQGALAASTAEWKLVVFHNPPYSSIPGKSAQWMEWPFAAWGADLVLNGDAHVYERLQVDGFDYVISGLGINNSPTPSPFHSASRVFYSADDAGALFITACAGAMELEYRALVAGIVDTYTIGTGSCS